ncbi:MAG: hypothetical protein ACM3XO_27335, partial [Bacteroidota bacterium]
MQPVTAKLADGSEPPAEPKVPPSPQPAGEASAQPVAAESKQSPSPVLSTALSAQAGTLSGSIRPKARPHAFVIMPFGKKTGADGTYYDFNAIYTLLIKPALEAANFEAFRADLCIADLSIDNANVFYELGIRHALRKRGIVHIQAGRGYMPFDVFNVR